MAKFRLHKVANNTHGRDSTKGKEARKTRNAPFMMPRIPGAANLNAVLMRLPALKVKKRRGGGGEENMCNLSRKEGSSLFAVLAKRQRKTLPKTFIFTWSGFVFLFWPEEMQFRRSHISLTRSLLTGKKHGWWVEAVP